MVSSFYLSKHSIHPVNHKLQTFFLPNACFAIYYDPSITQTIYAISHGSSENTLKHLYVIGNMCSYALRSKFGIKPFSLHVHTMICWVKPTNSHFSINPIPIYMLFFIFLAYNVTCFSSKYLCCIMFQHFLAVSVLAHAI